MHSINGEIEKRIQSSFWSEEIAGKVISERSRRRKRNLSVVGSLTVVFFLFFVVGFNVSRIEPASTSWNETLISTVTESINPYIIPEDVDEFIEYSFNGQ
ncbi:hypothetical protein JW879_06965 [candidate division WOR-3 bacterium]|nr:hypothetical protein [candidate division WOR-3 bacterium]